MTKLRSERRGQAFDGPCASNRSSYLSVNNWNANSGPPLDASCLESRLATVRDPLLPLTTAIHRSTFPTPALHSHLRYLRISTCDTSSIIPMARLGELFHILKSNETFVALMQPPSFKRLGDGERTTSRKRPAR